MFNPTHVCSNHEAQFPFPLPARQMKDRAQVSYTDPSGTSQPPCLCFFQCPSFFSYFCKLWLLLQVLHRMQCWSTMPMFFLIYKHFSSILQGQHVQYSWLSLPKLCLCLGLLKCGQYPCQQSPFAGTIHHHLSKPQPMSIQAHLCHHHHPAQWSQRKPSTDNINSNQSRICLLITQGPTSSFLPNSSHPSPHRILCSHQSTSNTP